MITKLEQTNKVEVQYTVEEDGLTYMDTLLFDEEIPADLKQTITDKFAVWKNYMLTPAKIPTKQDKEAEILQLEKQIANAVALKAKLEEEIK